MQCVSEYSYKNGSQLECARQTGKTLTVDRGFAGVCSNFQLPIILEWNLLFHQSQENASLVWIMNFPPECASGRMK